MMFRDWLILVALLLGPLLAAALLHVLDRCQPPRRRMRRTRGRTKVRLPRPPGSGGKSAADRGTAVGRTAVVGRRSPDGRFTGGRSPDGKTAVDGHV